MTPNFYSFFGLFESGRFTQVLLYTFKMSHSFLMLLDIVKLKMGYVSGEMEFPQIVQVCLTGFALAEINHELISMAILLPSAGSDS